MDTKDIVIFVVVFSYAGFRIYQKYFKKGTDKSKEPLKGSNDQKFSASSKDDDYEPYSRK